MSNLQSGKSGIKPFIISVSARALFDLEESHEVYEKEGLEAFARYQQARENEPLKPGPAFSIVKKLLDINNILPEGATPFEVVLLSRNSSDTSIRVLNSVDHYGLNVIRAIFTGGEPTSDYVDAIGSKLFLSSNAKEVRKVIEQTGIAAATIYPKSGQSQTSNSEQIRIAFDGDAVIFSDQSEVVYGKGGLDAFHQHERDHVHTPLPEGPLFNFLEAIHTIQKVFPKNACPIRTALVTARSNPAHKRALLTLRDWGIEIDNAMFLGGRDKAPFLKAFKADLFFDDSTYNVENAMNEVPSAHVPYGIRNDAGSKDSNFSGGTVVEAPKPKKPGR